MRIVLFACMAVLALSGGACADDAGWRVVLKSGGVLTGQLLRQNSVEVELKTPERGVVVIPKLDIELLERVKGLVTAQIPSATPARIDGVPERFSIAQADAIRLELGSRVKGLAADTSLAFETREFGKGRWKWPGPFRGFVYADSCPEPDRSREVGELVYRLERAADGETLQWVPLRWDPTRREWSVRGFVPATLAVHRRLEILRSELDEETVRLARVADLAQRQKGDRRPPNKVIEAMRHELLVRQERATRLYVQSAWAARKFLPPDVAVAATQVLEAGQPDGAPRRQDSVKIPEKVELPKEGKGETSAIRRD